MSLVYRAGFTALASALLLCSGGELRMREGAPDVSAFFAFSKASADGQGNATEAHPEEGAGTGTGTHSNGAATGVNGANSPARDRQSQTRIQIKDLPPLPVVPAGDRISLGYDAAKHMVRLHMHLGTSGKGDFDTRRSGSGTHFYWGKRKELLSSMGDGGWHQAKSLELLEKAVNPTENRFQHAMTMTEPKGESHINKTRLGIGGVSFSPFEVIGVNLDDESIERARSLGFKADVATQGGLRIVRFLVPFSTDAIRGRETLSKEFPGHQFEFNKVYRLYRAQMREDSGAPKASEPASPMHACPPERCFARKLIQWQDHLGACAKGLRIGIVDTGIDTDHPAFSGARIHYENFAPANRPPAPDWHGTGVLAVLAGNPDSGTPGLVPSAEFYAASVFFSEDNGAMATDTFSLMRALAWMKDNDVKIVNMSFAGPHDELVERQVEKLSGEGIVFVAAAGNEGPAAEPAYPAAYPQVIAVTAVTKDLLNYRYANRGEHIDVAAPGVDIWTAVPGAREGFHSGTSFAAPHVTGILALVLRDNPMADKSDPIGYKNDLLGSVPVIDLGPPGRDPVYGRGLLVAPSYCAPPSDTVASAAP
ncbi:MAG: S8 family serine peptidase [Rhodomicrobium sp.]